MPIYEYQCLQCGHRVEVILRMDDKAPTRCEECGGELKKLVSAPAFQFKGSGWYVTDYAGKKGGAEGKDGKKEKGGSEGDSSSASSESSAGPASSAKDSAAGSSSTDAKSSDKGGDKKSGDKTSTTAPASPAAKPSSSS